MPGSAWILLADDPTRIGGLRVDVGLATLFYLPMLGLWAWHRLSDRGDKDVALWMLALLLGAGVPYSVVATTDGAPQVLALCALAALATVAVVLHLRSDRQPAPAGARVRRTGWRLWLRVAGAAVCALFAVAAATSEVTVGRGDQEIVCGSIPDALDRDPVDDRCGGEGRMTVFGAVAFTGGAAYLTWSALRGARRPV